MPAPEQPKTPSEKLRQAGKWVLEIADPLVAAVAGLGLAVAGIVGWIQGDTLTATALFVLSAVALSLLRERGLRVNANEKIDRFGEKLDATTDAVNAIQAGNPYTVLKHDATWDIIKPDGSLVRSTRTKTIRFDQNDVASLFDLSEGDGTRDVTYSPGKGVATFLGEGRWCTLIALGRLHFRGEQIDFRVTRLAKNAFLEPHESITTLTRDATYLMCLRIIWPKVRPPTAVRLGRATPSRVWRNRDVLSEVQPNKDGRPEYTIMIHDPEKGGLTCIEWEWDPIPEEKPDGSADGRAGATTVAKSEATAGGSAGIETEAGIES